MIDPLIALAVVCSSTVFTCVGFYWGFYSGINTSVKLLADYGYVKHTVLETGEIKLYKLNEDS
jgi:hypothetical protein